MKIKPFYFEVTGLAAEEFTDLVSLIARQGATIISAPNIVITGGAEPFITVDLVCPKKHPLFGMDYEGEFVCYESKFWKDYGRGAEFIVDPELDYIKKRALESCCAKEIDSILAEMQLVEMQSVLSNIKEIRKDFLEKLEQRKRSVS